MREIQALLALLAKRIGFRLAPGISERVVFRELFMKGLTALDLPEARDGQSEVGSHVAARREIQGLLQTIGVLEAERSEEHTSEIQSLMRISYDVFCFKKNNII